MRNKIITMKLLEFIKPNIAFIVCLFIFALLLARNPFSTRNLIPNFEPSPDAIYYVNTARSLLNGQGFEVSRNGRGFIPYVPPLYSLSFLPIFALNNDPRLFYVMNVLLMLSSFVLLYLIVKKITDNTWIISFVLFLFVTNFYIYWYPTLAMAENLILPLFLASILLLMTKISYKNIVLAAIIDVAFYATKYEAISLSGIYFLIYIFKLFRSRESRYKFKLMIFIIIFVILFGSFSLYEYLSKNNLDIFYFIFNSLTFAFAKKSN